MKASYVYLQAILVFTIMFTFTCYGFASFDDFSSSSENDEWEDISLSEDESDKKINEHGFEIQNKANPIWVVLVKNHILTNFKINQNAKKNLAIDLNKPLVIGVYTQQPKQLPEEFINGRFKDSQPTYIYTIDAKNKTKYLTWNPDKHKKPEKYFYPQRGPLLGINRKTASGYSLRNNISQEDIYFKKNKAVI